MVAIALLLSWVLWLAVLLGAGSWLAAWTRAPATVVERFLAGVALALGYAAAVSLLVPVDGPWPVAFVGFGLAGAWRARAGLRGSLGRLELAAGLLLAVPAVVASLRPVTSPDASLYFISAIRAAESIGTLTGLATLNPYAALNQSIAPLNALVAIGPFDGAGWHVLNGLLTWVAVTAGVVLLARGRLAGMAAAPAADGLTWTNISAGGGDDAVTALGALCVMAALTTRVRAPGPSLLFRGLAVAGLLTAKQTLLWAAPVLLAEPVVACVRAGRWRSLLVTAAGGMGLMVPWMARSVLMSGYPLYPVPVQLFPVPWQASPELARAVLDWAWVYARRPLMTFVPAAELGPWVADWLYRESLNNRTSVIPAALTVAAALAVGVTAALRPARARRVRWVVPLTLVALCAGWWLSSPDPRFAQATLWGLPTALLVTVQSLALKPTERRLTSPLGAAALLAALVGYVPPRELPRLPPLPAGRGQVERLETGEEIPRRVCFEAVCSQVITGCVRARRPGHLEAGFEPGRCESFPAALHYRRPPPGDTTPTR